VLEAAFGRVNADVKRKFLGPRSGGHDDTQAEGRRVELIDGDDQARPGAGLIVAARGVEEVLPLDDAARLDEAKPIGPAGRYHPDPAKLAARHDGQGQGALKDGESPPDATGSLQGKDERFISPRTVENHWENVMRLSKRSVSEVGGVAHRYSGAVGDPPRYTRVRHYRHYRHYGRGCTGVRHYRHYGDQRGRRAVLAPA
jgi:hypothetical protein